MHYLKAEVTENLEMTPDIHLIRLKPEQPVEFLPGQFLNLYFKGALLPRPFTIFEAQNDVIKILVKIRGRFTAELCQKRTGSIINMLGPIGSPLPDPGDNNCIITGGIGLAPFHWLVKKNRKAHFDVFSFFTKKEELDLIKLVNYKNVQAEGILDDTKNRLIDFFDQIDLSVYESIYICAAKIVYKKVWHKIPENAMISLDERIGCGVGGCLGCTIISTAGPKKVCKDGPFFRKGEVLDV